MCHAARFVQTCLCPPSPLKLEFDVGLHASGGGGSSSGGGGGSSSSSLLGIWWRRGRRCGVGWRGSSCCQLCQCLLHHIAVAKLLQLLLQCKDRGEEVKEGVVRNA